MTGKYARVIDQLRKLPPNRDDKTYQDKVETMKVLIRDQAPRLGGWSAGELALEYKRLRHMIDWLKDGDVDVPPWIYDLANKLAAADIKDYPRVLAEGIRPLYDLNLELEAISQMIVDQFEVEGTSSVRLASDGSAITVQIEPYAVVKDKEAFRVWCLNNGLAESLALPWQTTNSLAKQYLLDGQSAPDGVEVFQKTKIVLRK